MQNNTVDLSYIKDNVNFFDLVQYFEEQKVQVSYNSVKLCCPFHKEKTASFFYNIEKKFYRCYGCQKTGDLFDYVSHKTGNTFKQTLDFLIQFGNIGNIPSGELKKVNSYKKEMYAVQKLQKKEIKEFTLFSEDDVKSFIEFRKSLKLKTIFTEETLDFFEAGFDPREKRIVVPIRNEYRQLIGITGRTIEKKYKDLDIAKWKHYNGSSVSSTFFNINNAISYSKENNSSIIIVEGPKDVMWLHQNGIRNVVACLTNNISQQQKNILLKNFISIYLMLDADAGGEVGKSDILNKIDGYFNIYDVKIEAGKDPDQLTKEELEDAIRESTKIR